MRELDFLKQQHLRGRISRREFLGRAAALGASAALL
ncbi:MAG: twin-arginine translocation signal domain-containing protein, partial [Methylobacteriaceae bacterium]|nr:twin-arginine translocation signal domain-containing protein [Methylobacteriaceae bacterium]